MLVFVLAIFGVLALVLKPWEQREPPDERPWAWHVDDDQIVHVEVTHKGKPSFMTRTWDAVNGS